MKRKLGKITLGLFLFLYCYTAMKNLMAQNHNFPNQTIQKSFFR
jgi:hypothetical protein